MQPRTKSAAPAPRVLSVVHGTSVFEVVLKRVSGAKRLTLRVRAADGAAVLSLPPRATVASAAAFAERQAGWIAARLAALPRPIGLVPGATVPLRGIDHLIRHDPGALRRVRVSADGAPEILVATRESDPEGAILRLLMREARRDLEAAVARHAARVGRPVTRLTLRDTRSRWGSCSSRGALNFSWRLILAPPEVLDYLAAHEVAHLVHMNHSDAFWALTRRLAPQTEAAELWLKQHGATLHRFARRGPQRLTKVR